MKRKPQPRQSNSVLWFEPVTSWIWSKSKYYPLRNNIWQNWKGGRWERQRERIKIIQERLSVAHIVSHFKHTYSVSFILLKSVCTWSKTKPAGIKQINPHENARYPFFSWLQFILTSSLYDVYSKHCKKKWRAQWAWKNAIWIS
jgi:hypothetical protein